MKLTIAEIREEYRNATDKPEAIRKLAASEEVSEQTIKFYVRGTNGPDRPIDKPVPIITNIPVPEKRRRPAKNAVAAKPKKKAPAKARPVDKVIHMKAITPKTVVADPDLNAYRVRVVIDGKKTVIEDQPTVDTGVLQYTHFEPVPVTQEEREMFFADITDDAPEEQQKPAMTLLGQEVKNFDDVQRVIHEAKAAKEKAIAVAGRYYGVGLTLKEGMNIIQEGQETPCTERDEPLNKIAKSFSDLAKTAQNLVPVKPVCPVIPVTFDEMHSLDKKIDEPELENRIKWEDKRKASVMHALFKRLKDAKELPAEWVAEWNERCGG